MRNLLRPLKRALATVRVWQARWRGAVLGPECQLASGVVLALGASRGVRGKVVLGPRCELCQGAVLRAWGGAIHLGTNVFVGEYSVIYGHGGVRIGEDTLISMHCRIVSSNHTVPGRAAHIRHEPDLLLSTTIGKDVWLGAGVTVLGGVTIGDGCVVAAGAVVARDLPPYAVALGVPARVIRFRE